VDDRICFGKLTKSLEMAANEISKACAASQKGLTVAMQPQHSDTRVLDNKQKPVDGSPPEHKAGLRPRAASAARARPSPSDVPPAWPHKQSGAASWAGVQPAHPSGTKFPSRSSTDVPRKQQQPVSLHSSVLKASPQHAPERETRSAAGSVAGSAAPSLAATLGMIHRQLAATSVPLKGGDAKDAKAWMMHNPKHAILQTQARLNRLARLDRPSPKDQQLSSSPLLQPNGQPLRAPSPMGSAAPVRRMSNQQQQQLQQHAERPSGALGLGSRGSSASQDFPLRPMPSHPDPFPRPTLQLPHTTATHPAAGATGLAGRGTFQLHSYGNNNNNISVNNKAASNDQGLNVPGGGRERPGAGPAPFQSTMMGMGRGATPAGPLQAHNPANANGASRPPSSHQMLWGKGPVLGVGAQGNGVGGPSQQQEARQAWMPPTESTLRQLPVMPKPWVYRPVPSEVGSHADWWRSGVNSAVGSVRSYPRTAVTDRDSVTPSELAAWEARMSNLEATIQDEKRRRKQFEEELRQLEALAVSRGAITTGGIAVAKGPTAGNQTRPLQQQQQQQGQQSRGAFLHS